MRRFLLLLILCASAAAGPVLTATPNPLLPGVHSQLNLRCSLTPDSSDVSRVLVIQIEKINGFQIRPLASLTTGESPKLNTALSSRQKLSVTGTIADNHPADSFLQVDVTEPDPDDGGMYLCAMSVLDKQSLLHRMETSLNLSLTETNGSLASGLLLTELRTLQTQVDTLANQVRASNSNTAGCVCCSKAPSQTPTIAFMTRPSDRRPFLIGKLEFDTVDVNIGGAFDSVHSTFVAPVNGTYAIMASVSMDSAKTITELKVNGESKAQISTQDDDQSSVSAVLHLESGDRVWLQGIYASRNTTSMFADKDTLFSGFLLGQP